MSDLLAILQECYREILASLARHQAHARRIGQYDVNNTYQYILNRQETQLSWLAAAIAELGGQPSEEPASSDGQDVRGDAAGVTSAVEEDAREAQAFVDRWRPRVDAMPNARHAKMLRVILGESLEQKRFFEQALAGRTDLLGRRAAQPEPACGEVLPTRWVE